MNWRASIIVDIRRRTGDRYIESARDLRCAISAEDSLPRRSVGRTGDLQAVSPMGASECAFFLIFYYQGITAIW
jgi:hypothetical protein